MIVGKPGLLWGFTSGGWAKVLFTSQRNTTCSWGGEEGTKLGLGFGFGFQRFVQNQWEDIRIKMENSQHFSFLQKVKNSKPDLWPEQFKALYSETGVRPDLRERQGDRMKTGQRREDGFPVPCQCAITTEVAHWKDWPTRCLVLAEAPSKFIFLDAPKLPSPSNIKQDELNDLMVKMIFILFYYY